MKDRINQFLAHESISPAEFADKIGVQRSSVSHVLNGRNYPSAAFIQKMLSSYKALNPRWLLLGEGTMFEVKSGQAQEPPLLQFSDEKGTLKAQIPPISEVIPTVVTQLSQPQIDKPLSTENKIDSPLKTVSPVQTVPPQNVSEILLPELSEKEVERIVLFYKDKTFTAYTPSK